MSTKAELEIQVAELQKQLAAAEAAAEVTPEAAPRLPGFANYVWLPRDIDEVVTMKDGTSFKPVRYGTTNNGSRFIEWSAQVDTYNKRLGKRIYSKAKFTFKAWNDQCDQVMRLIQEDNRLVEVTANFLPDAWTKDGVEYTKDYWFVLSVDAVERKDLES